MRTHRGEVRLRLFNRVTVLCLAAIAIVSAVVLAGLNAALPPQNQDADVYAVAALIALGGLAGGIWATRWQFIVDAQGLHQPRWFWFGHTYWSWDDFAAGKVTPCTAQGVYRRTTGRGELHLDYLPEADAGWLVPLVEALLRTAPGVAPEAPVQWEVARDGVRLTCDAAGVQLVQHGREVAVSWRDVRSLVAVRWRHGQRRILTVDLELPEGFVRVWSAPVHFLRGISYLCWLRCSPEQLRDGLAALERYVPRSRQTHVARFGPPHTAAEAKLRLETSDRKHTAERQLLAFVIVLCVVSGLVLRFGGQNDGIVFLASIVFPTLLILIRATIRSERQKFLHEQARLLDYLGVRIP